MLPQSSSSVLALSLAPFLGVGKNADLLRQVVGANSRTWAGRSGAQVDVPGGPVTKALGSERAETGAALHHHRRSPHAHQARSTRRHAPWHSWSPYYEPPITFSSTKETRRTLHSDMQTCAKKKHPYFHMLASYSECLQHSRTGAKVPFERHGPHGLTALSVEEVEFYAVWTVFEICTHGSGNSNES